ncbi:MAG: M48 family metallopeptidase [Campylobacter sp.]|nr:M48 family metallopeptidase [Campylobacter sp.]MBR2157065.1 M48 family metallopeptidase [Campylobacter sp.]MBR4141301.1 M48 family metallopeptidase [Campylobacter sp.]MBR6952870.1 M48 family metallopeptidase [Campylobacter sp.]MBR7047483.1 M48 family metallopeptidase [Campylobacter sp.]
MKKLVLLVSIFIGVVFSGCASTTQGGVVGANRTQLLVVSEEAMNQSATLAYADTLKKANASKTLNTDKKQTDRVKNISTKLINQVGVFRPDALKWNWEVNVINDKTVNAWCMPGGKIAVYTGIINSLKLTDAELAAVIGHEIAHALREHSREQASQDQLKNVGIFAVSQAAGLGDLGTAAVNMAAHYTISLPFSRSHESEADLMGLELMARAGYDPNAAVNVWKKMSLLSEGSTPQFLSTHPSNETRIQELNKAIPKVMPLYEATKKSTKTAKK